MSREIVNGGEHFAEGRARSVKKCAPFRRVAQLSTLTTLPRVHHGSMKTVRIEPPGVKALPRFLTQRADDEAGSSAVSWHGALNCANESMAPVRALHLDPARPRGRAYMQCVCRLLGRCVAIRFASRRAIGAPRWLPGSSKAKI